MKQRAFSFAKPRVRRQDRVKGIRMFLRSQLDSYRSARMAGATPTQLRVRAELFAHTLCLLGHG